MITYYCRSLEDALKKAKQAGKQPGCEYRGITLDGKRGFAVYKNENLVGRYVALSCCRQEKNPYGIFLAEFEEMFPQDRYVVFHIKDYPAKLILK